MLIYYVQDIEGVVVGGHVEAADVADAVKIVSASLEARSPDCLEVLGPNWIEWYPFRCCSQFWFYATKQGCYNFLDGKGWDFEDCIKFPHDDERNRTIATRDQVLSAEWSA
jgi:hypothetical protein